MDKSFGYQTESSAFEPQMGWSPNQMVTGLLRRPYKLKELNDVLANTYV